MIDREDDFAAQLDALDGAAQDSEVTGVSQTSDALSRSPLYNQVREWHASQRQRQVQDAVEGSSASAAVSQPVQAEAPAPEVKSPAPLEDSQARFARSFWGMTNEEISASRKSRESFGTVDPGEQKALAEQRAAEANRVASEATAGLQSAHAALDAYERENPSRAAEGGGAPSEYPTGETDLRKVALENMVRHYQGALESALYDQKQAAAVLANPGTALMGPGTEFKRGLRGIASNVAQTSQVIKGEQLTGSETSPNYNFEGSDLRNFREGAVPKFAHQLGGMTAQLAAAAAGGAAGGAAAGPFGVLPGSAAAVGIESAIEALGPRFEKRLRQMPNDPDGAFNAAIGDAARDGAFSTVSWGAFGLRLFSGPVKNALFQSFGVQPAIGMAHQAAQNVSEGEPVTKDLGQAAAQTAIGTLAPMALHAAITHVAGTAASGVRNAISPESSPAEIEAFLRAAAPADKQAFWNAANAQAREGNQPLLPPPATGKGGEPPAGAPAAAPPPPSPEGPAAPQQSPLTAAVQRAEEIVPRDAEGNPDFGAIARTIENLPPEQRVQAAETVARFLADPEAAAGAVQSIMARPPAPETAPAPIPAAIAEVPSPAQETAPAASLEPDAASHIQNVEDILTTLAGSGEEPAAYFGTSPHHDPVTQALAEAFWQQGQDIETVKRRLEQFRREYDQEAQAESSARSGTGQALAQEPAGGAGPAEGLEPQGGVGRAPEYGGAGTGPASQGANAGGGGQAGQPGAAGERLARDRSTTGGTPQHGDKFRSILSGSAKRGEWAGKLGVSDAELEQVYIPWAKGEKLLRQTKNGVFRTAKTKEPEPKRQSAHTVVTPDGSMRLSVAPQIVELSSLKQAAGAMQPRDRSRAESAVGVRERAANLDPARLQAAPTSDQGAPVIAPDGTILSGNGRALSIQEAYRNPSLKAQAEAYRAALGPEAAGMKEPVLVMRAPADMPEAQMREFADLSNRSSIAAMSATERAIRDANRIGIEAFAGYKGGELTSAANRRFLQDFLARAVTPNELGAMSKDGVLTKEGHDRVNAAILAAAYRDADTLSLMLEATDSNIKSVVTAMREAAGKFAELRAAMDAGLIDKKLDAAPSLVQAVKLISHLRDKGVKPDTYFAQSDAFDVRDPLVEDWVRAFYNNDLSRALSQQKMAEVLNAYADEAIKHQTGGFIEDATTAREVIAAAVKQRDTGGQSSLFARVPGDHGAGDAGGGREAPGRELAGGGGAFGGRVSVTHEARFRAERAADEFESVYGRKPRQSAINYAAALEAAHEQKAGFQEIIDAAIADKTFTARDALDLSELLGKTVHPEMGKDEALGDIALAKGYLTSDNILAALARGEVAEVPHEAVQEAHVILEAYGSEVPSRVQSGALTHIEPIGGPGGNRARLNFVTPDGREFARIVPRREATGFRAAYFRSNRSIGLAHTGVGGERAAEPLTNALAGQVRHEITHALRHQGLFTAGEWRSLVDHAENLQILDVELWRYLERVGDPNFRQAGEGVTIRDAYEREYGGAPDFQELMNQEAVAHAVELYHHMQTLPSDHLLSLEVMPRYREIEPILQKMFSGEIAARDPAEVKDFDAGKIAAITAYHGGPHDFDRFDISKIGTGEGSQAYGHGLYFAENPSVSDFYRKTYEGLGAKQSGMMPDELLDTHGNIIPEDKWKEVLDWKYGEGEWRIDDGELHSIGDDGEWYLRGHVSAPGRLYTVSLDVEPHELLDWDKPLSADAINKIEKIPELAGSDYFKKWMRDPDVTGRDVYESIGNVLSGGSGKNHAGHIATGVLHEAGIPGIRYLDQGSRAAGEGSHNFVIFDDSKVKITAKDGKPVSPEERADVLDQSQEEQKPQFALGGDRYRFTEEEKPYAIVWGSEAGLAAADLMRQRQRLAGLETQATGGDAKAADQARMRAAMIDQKAQTLVREWSASGNAENKAAAGDLATAAASLNTAFAAQDWNAFRAAARDLDAAMGRFDDFTRRAYDAYEAKRAAGEAEASYANAASKTADQLSPFDRARFDAHFKTREAFDDIASEADFYGEDFDAAVSKKESPDLHANIKLYRKIEKKFPDLADELRAAAETQPSAQDRPQEEEQPPVYALSAAPGVSPVLRPLSEALEKLRATMGLPEKLGRHGISPAGGATVHPDARSDRDVAASLDDLALAGADHVGAMLGDSLEAAKTAHAAELERLGDPKSADRLESGFAAFFHQFVRNPDAAQADAPRFYRELEDLLDARDPALLEQMQAMQDLMKMTQVQAKLAQLGIDPKFQAEFGVPRHELFPRLANSVAPYVRAATAYKALAKSPQAADAYLAKLPSSIRDYVLFQGRRDVAALHPLVRIKALTDLVYKMQWEALRNQLRNTSKDGGPERIYLAPKKAQDVNDITMRLAAAELNNAAAFTGASPDAKVRGEVATTPIMNELRDRSPEVYHELLRRMGKAKIVPWSTVKSIYPPTAKLVAKGWMDQREATKLSDGAANGSPPQGPGDPPSPPAGGPGGGPAPADFGMPKDRRKARNMFLDAWIRTIQPEAYSEDARKADARFAEMAAAKAQQQDSLAAKYDDDYIKWERVPEDKRLEFFQKVETGDLASLPDWEREQADIVKKAMDWAYAEELKMGSKAEFRDNYMPHVWDNPKEFQALVKSLMSVQKLGPRWFQKARMFDLIQQGLDAGLKLKTTNPIDLMTMRLVASVQMREVMRLLKDMRDQYGLAVKAEGAPEHFVQNGWRVIDAPDQERWLIAPDIQPLWNNTLDGKGLWANSEWQGSAFRGWMAFKNVWVPLKLAWSGFHPLHVMHINFSNHLTRAKQEFTAGRFVQAGKNVLRATDLIGAATSKRGSQAREAWLKPEEEQTPDERHLVGLMRDGGFSPQLSEQLKIQAKRQLGKALAGLKFSFEGKSIGGVSGHSAQVFWYGFKRFMELQPFSLLFERWIPNMKTSSYLWDAASFAERNPDIWADPIQRKVALRTIAAQVDNRYGQMFYGSLFWNKTLKDSLMGAFISLGWQTGFVRDAGGAVASPFAQTSDWARGKKPSETMRTVRAAENKTSYWGIYFATFAFMINAIMTKMFTGDNPEGMDFIFARIGGKNPDGTPRRITNMSYLREIPMWLKHAEEEGGGVRGAIFGTKNMFMNKTLIGPFAEFASNRDYYGNQLYDPYSKAWLPQLIGSELRSQVSPITVSGAAHAADIAGTWWDRAIPLSVLGFGPAPAYAARTATQNRIAHLYNEFVAPKSKPYTDRQHNEAVMHARTAYKVAQQKGGAELMSEAMKELSAAGAKPPKGTPGDVFMFGKLPASQQMAVLEDAPPEEAKKYIAHARKTLAATPEFMKFRIEHARQTMPQPMQ